MKHLIEIASEKFFHQFKQLTAGLCVLCSVVSCGFLEIDTPGIVNKDKMFENEQGFIDAMDGVYSSMTRPELYGEQLSFGFIDEIAQLYYNDYESSETVLTRTYDLKYLDEDVRMQIDAIWNGMYNVISSANSILDQVGQHDFAILPRIKGEALAVRAYLHFDLLRLFAPNFDRPEAKAIPYVEHFSIQPVQRSTVREVYERIVRDLEESYHLLQEARAIEGHEKTFLYVSDKAAAALLARVTNWAGDHEKAEMYALKALEGNFRMTRESEVKTLFMGYTAHKECIWGLHAPMMYLNVRSCLFPTRLTERFNMVRDQFKEIFRVSTFTAANNDYRYQGYFTQTQWIHSVYCLTKLFDPYYDKEQQVPENRTPGINLVRLPELYYILAESVYGKDPHKALDYLNDVITARGLLPLDFEKIDTPNEFQKELINEITKEFWGEGQIFFTYKRFNLDMDGVNGKFHPASDKVYILPLPENEQSEGVD